MRATAIEYRLRFFVYAVIFGLGFWAPWDADRAVAYFARPKVWPLLAQTLAGHGLLSFVSATYLVLWVAIVLLAVGAWLRVWGAAYVGASVVQSMSMHGERLLADGPYRRTRNPLYLGTILHAFGLAVLMPPSGAVFAIVLVWVFSFRLALAEEPFLAGKFGDAYREYARKVPRFLPALSPQVAASGERGRWAMAVLGEIYPLGVVVTFVAVGWQFNAITLIQGVVVSLGVSIVVRAMLPRAKTASR